MEIGGDLSSVLKAPFQSFRSARNGMKEYVAVDGQEELDLAAVS